MRHLRIPGVSIKRLTAYWQTARQLAAEGVSLVPSGELARCASHSEHIIRKDLALIGNFGTKGTGYDLSTLITGIATALGLDRHPRAALVGVGFLGTALLRYSQARPGPVRIVAAFDRDEDKVGRWVGDVRVLPFRDLQRVIRDLGVTVAVIAVPGPEARMVAELLQAAGVRAILNFAPARITSNRRCHVENIDLMATMQSLAYYTCPDAEMEYPQTGAMD